MKYRSGLVVVSPTDLAEFMRSRFATWMSRLALDHPELRPNIDATEPEALPDIGDLLAQRGLAHEARVLTSFRDAGRDVVEIEVFGEKAHEQTLAAMRAGRELIFQAHLEDAPFSGIADFLLRVPGRSELGDFHYEVWDAKLARHAKPTHVLQLCCYADMLAAVQGVRPETVSLALGDGSVEAFRVADFFYFYRSLRDAFLAFLASWRADGAPLPDPSADHGRWQDEAERRLEACDHVSRVAFCTSGQARKLAAAQIESLAALADTDLHRVAGIEDRVFARLREQARLQRGSQGLPRPMHRILHPDEVEEGKGLSLLPPASPGDVCFDLEGDPLEIDGLEYLWGVTYRDDAGARVYRDWWARDRAEERAALESFLDWLSARRERFPDLHVFHYASYETATLRRLVGREATREDDLDVLLRAGVFVDLYAVVRHGARVGEPRYALKNVERLYRGARAGDVASGMDSVVVYDVWRQSDEPPDWRASPLLRQIRDYNEEDCRSTAELLDWLRERQREAAIAFRSRPAPEKDENDDDDRSAARAARRELAKRMLGEIPATEEERAPDRERWIVQELLGQLLEYHHREMRPVYWELFDRAAMSVEERFGQPGCLAGLERISASPLRIKRSWGYEYRYDASQDTKIRQGDGCRLAQHPFVTVEVETLDAEAGRVVLKITQKKLDEAGLDALPAQVCLIEFDHRGTEEIEAAIGDIAARFHSDEQLDPLLRDLLLRRSPRIRDQAAGPIRRAAKSPGDALLRAVRNLEGSVLCVQGPPGSGKTTESAKVIGALLRDGFKVGICSNSHKVIANLMNACAKQSGGHLACAKVGGEEDEAPDFAGCVFLKDGKAAAAAISRFSLFGGTAWCFANQGLAGQLDYLFIDEASQVSLANVVAISRAARNLVLVGDQMQLSQPRRGSHPGESGLSSLDFALAGQVTIPDDRGIFLETTYRLHPSICAFVSGAFYEDRLHPDPRNERRAVQGMDPGLRFVPVPHEGNTQGSDEEVEAVRGIIDGLIGRPFVDRDGNDAGAIGLEEILVVAPYNLQVRKLIAALPPGARVGTVDRFQGQEAPVVIVSMCASEPHLSARGIEFLFHPNRLNVAVSRAQCAAFVVGEPRLAAALCRSVGEMKMVNRVCRMVLGEG